MNKMLLMLVGILSLFFSYSDVCVAQPKLKVTGILQTGKPLAIVNGETVEVGDVIGGAKVIEIGQDSVTFNYQGNTFMKGLGEGSRELGDKIKEEKVAHPTRKKPTPIKPESKVVKDRMAEDKKGGRAWGERRIVDFNQLTVVDDLYYVTGEEKPFTGKVPTYYPNGNRKSEIELLDGKAHGKWFKWHENGQKQAENYWLGAGRQKVIYWFENGQKQRETEYRDRIRHGKSIQWYETGQMKWEVEWCDGKAVSYECWDKSGKPKPCPIFVDVQAEGLVAGQKIAESGKIEEKTEKWPNGNLKHVYQTTKTKEGMRIKVEKETRWYENGQRTSEMNWENGLPEGKSIGWHENGQKKYDGNFKNGEKDGKWCYWYENGQKAYEMDYKDGEYHGKVIRWYENGQKNTEGIYWEGKSKGKTQIWRKNGEKYGE